MKILYIFPHPDDESFGPAGVIHQQVKNGDEIFLLTLTRGGATRVRHELGLTKEEMGAVRVEEMQKVKEVLGISQMYILNLEDGGLAKLNPLELENLIEEWILKIQPNIVITYPVHGGSGHHDHIALFAAVNHTFHSLKPSQHYLKRLAFFTLPDSGESIFLKDGTPRVTWTPRERIGAIIPLSEDDKEAMKQALLCYGTYQDVVKTSKVVERIGDHVHFEISLETFTTPISSLSEFP